jgi:hypothetical protein
LIPTQDFTLDKSLFLKLDAGTIEGLNNFKKPNQKTIQIESKDNRPVSVVVSLGKTTGDAYLALPVATWGKL